MKKSNRRVSFCCRLHLVFFSLFAAQVADAATIINIPTLGGTSLGARAINPDGHVVGFSTTAGNVAQHGFLCRDGAVTDVGTLGGTFSLASAINATDQVVGDATTTNDLRMHAFLRSSGVMQDLGTLGGSWSTATAVNNAGQVVGNSLLQGDLQSHAFRFSGGVMLDLGTLGGSYSGAAAINNVGQVAGDSGTAQDVDTHGFLFSGGVMTDLIPLGGTYSSARALNDAGVVVGETSTSSGDMHGFVYNGTMTDVGTLGGTYSTAYAINQSGQVIGDASTSNDEEYHAFVWTAGVMTDLGTLGGSFSTAAAINNRGQIVGDSSDASEFTFPFLWQDGVMVNLNTLVPTNSGWELWAALLISDNGHIVGYGAYQGNFNYYLLTLGGANRSPQANAGLDQRVECSGHPTSIVLDGSASSDPDGDTLSFDWRENDVLLGTGATASLGLSLGSHLITLSVADGHGGVSEDTVVVNVVDTTSPTVLCPAAETVVADADCHAAVPDFTASAIVVENCSVGLSLVRSQSLAAGTLVGVGAHAVVVTATDESGHSGSCTVTFTVADTTPPSVTCPEAVTASAGADCLAPVPDFRTSVVASDACTPATGLVVTQSPEAGTLVGLGTHTIVVTATDASDNGGSCTVTFHVADTTSPSVTCPDAVTASVDTNCFAPVPDFCTTVVATDACTPAPGLVATQNPAAGTLLGVGSHAVVVTVTDESGNSSSCTVTLNVADTTPPSLTCPPETTVSPGPNTVVPDFRTAVVTSDECTPRAELVVTQKPAAGTVVSAGTHVVTITVRDAAGNTSSCTTRFSVADITPPTVVCPSAVSGTAGAKGTAVVPNLVPRLRARDDSTPATALIKTQNPAAGTRVGLGVHVITFTVTDASGNSAVCTTTFTVRDATAPTIGNLAASPDSLTRVAGQMVPVTLLVSVSDNCDPAPVCQIVSVTSNEPVTSSGDNTAPDWEITGPLTVKLRAENSAEAGRRVYTVKVRCTDASGNSATKTVRVPVVAKGGPKK